MVMIKMPSIKTITAMAMLLSTTTSTVVEGFQLKNQEGASKKQVVEGNVIQVADEVLRSALSTTFSNVGQEFQDLAGNLGSDGGHIGSSSSSVVDVPSDPAVPFDTTTIGGATSGSGPALTRRWINYLPDRREGRCLSSGKRSQALSMEDGRSMECDGFIWDKSSECRTRWDHGTAFSPATQYTEEGLSGPPWSDYPSNHWNNNFRWDKYKNNFLQSLSGGLICSKECCKIQGGLVSWFGSNDNEEDRFREDWGIRPREIYDVRPDGRKRTKLCDWGMCGGCPECATKCEPGDLSPCPQD